MTVKEQLHEIADNLPENASIEDAMQRLYFLYKLEQAEQESDAGDTVSDEEAKKLMAKWLK